MDKFYLYIAVDSHNEILDIGVTVSLHRRHKLFQAVFELPYKFVYFEEYNSSKKATIRENKLKGMPKHLLKKLIEENNPAYKHLLTKDNDINN